MRRMKKYAALFLAMVMIAGIAGCESMKEEAPKEEVEETTETEEQEEETDEEEVAKAVLDAGYDPYEKKLLGITAMSNLLGKKQFEEILGGLVYKPPGKPALVPESDNRPEMNSAAEDFNDK